jgi:hypothetical protein
MRKKSVLLSSATAVITASVAVLSALPSWAGTFVISGFDPQYHAQDPGSNFIGARNTNRAIINYITDPSYNPFTANGVNRFLYVDSKIPTPPEHLPGVNGLIASGYTPGVNFEHHDASTLNAELNQLGTKYNAIVVASDYGATLTQAELNVLNSRRDDITQFLNAGGGIFVASESNGGAGLTPQGGRFGFLPFPVAARNLEQLRNDATVTPLAASVGLTNADINGNYSHNVFDPPFVDGLEPATIDASGNVLTIAGRTTFATEEAAAAVPEPSSILAMLVVGGIGSLGLHKRQHNKQVEN